MGGIEKILMNFSHANRGFGCACTRGYYPAQRNAASSPLGSFFRARFPRQGSSHLDEWIEATKPFVQSFSSERPEILFAKYL
jgi:hypothetical protein